MPELLRYDLLSHELIDRESNTQNIIDHLIKHLPRFNTSTQEIVLASFKNREEGSSGE